MKLSQTTLRFDLANDYCIVFNGDQVCPFLIYCQQMYIYTNVNKLFFTLQLSNVCAEQVPSALIGLPRKERNECKVCFFRGRASVLKLTDFTLYQIFRLRSMFFSEMQKIKDLALDTHDEAQNWYFYVHMYFTQKMDDLV